MDFTSPRFAGNPVLEAILRDPNTGTVKLTSGSDPVAVRAVQRALLDLDWVALSHVTANGRVLVITQFVDGDYGPWTEETVLAYKRHHDIHFPPDAPVGIFDGFTGPATMKALDHHCALLDGAAAAIAGHAEVLVATGALASLEFSPPDGVGRTTKPVRGAAAVMRSAVINGEVGSLIHKQGLGTFALRGPLFVAWVTHELAEGTGAATGRLGFPTSNIFEGGGESIVEVERGRLRLDHASGTTSVEIDPGATVLRSEVEF